LRKVETGIGIQPSGIKQVLNRNFKIST